MLGALFDAGLDLQAWMEAMKSVDLGAWELQEELVRSAELQARSIDIVAPSEAHQLDIQQTRSAMESSSLPPTVVKAASATIQLMEPHTETSTSHLETRSVLLVLGVHLASALLGLERHERTPFSIGKGLNPRVAELLRGQDMSLDSSRDPPLSPEGIALMRSLTESPEGPIPFHLERLCLGAPRGTAATHPGLLRLLIGSKTPAVDSQQLYQIETTLDDMDPELFPPLLARLRSCGARDAWWAPAVTRAGRPGSTVIVLAPFGSLQAIADTLFQETTTIGIRFHVVRRFTLKRSERTIRTRFGVIRVKDSILPDGSVRSKPELEDCVRAAREQGCSVREIREAIQKELGEAPHAS